MGAESGGFGGEAFVVEDSPETTEPLHSPELSPTELVEAQAIWARGRGRERWEAVGHLEQAEFWAIEGDHEAAGRAAEAAGLDRPQQLALMLLATSARLNALSWIADEDHPVERADFDRIDEVHQALSAERDRLEAARHSAR